MNFLIKLEHSHPSIEIDKLLITENNVLKGIKKEGIKRLELPDNIVSIADEAFLNSEIEEIVLNEGITHIGKHAFRGSRIYRINFPASLEEIGEHAF